MANGPGVSMAVMADGRWRVRWREEVVEDGVAKRAQRERKVRDEATAVELRAEILRAVETGRIFEEEQREVEATATLDDVLGGWLRAKHAVGLAGATFVNYGANVGRLLVAFRAVYGIPDDQPVPGSKLTRTGVTEVTNWMRRPGSMRDRQGGPTNKILSDGTIHKTISTLLDAWEWAADDPAEYPGIAPAPRVMEALRPRKPVYAPAPHATMAECDAVIRELARRPKTGDRALPATIIARCTGLRIRQILCLEAPDIDLGARTITVRTGKSERERAECRTIPFAPVLLETLAELVQRAGEGSLWRRRKDADGGNRPPDRTLASAWEACTLRGEVRREVWAPSNRANAKPDHAFRAAFQGLLQEQRVRGEVIDALVGHAGSVRDRHYVDRSIGHLLPMREAVALVPPIDWRGEVDEPSNVVAFGG